MRHQQTNIPDKNKVRKNILIMRLSFIVIASIVFSVSEGANIVLMLMLINNDRLIFGDFYQCYFLLEHIHLKTYVIFHLPNYRTHHLLIAKRLARLHYRHTRPVSPTYLIILILQKTNIVHKSLDIVPSSVAHI